MPRSLLASSSVYPSEEAGDPRNVRDARPDFWEESEFYALPVTGNNDNVLARSHYRLLIFNGLF